jgi:replicative superfamily II helicase
MAIGGPNPGIWGDSVRKALTPDEERGAHEHETSIEQTRLDKAELQELERSGSYGVAPDAAPLPSSLRRIVDRLFRRAG